MLTAKVLQGQSEKDSWRTPGYILEKVNLFYDGKWFDPCPSEPVLNGLNTPWPPKSYINPPFSQYLKWAKYGVLQPLEQIWICHHDSSTERFQILIPGATLCLLYERVSFIWPKTGKPKGTDIAKSQTLIYRGNHPQRFNQYFHGLGFIAEQTRLDLVFNTQ